MFTGLVEEMGLVTEAKRDPKETLRLVVKAPCVAKDAQIGDSIAINGCCLTVVKKAAGLLTFEAGSETMQRTNLGRLEKQSGVNLERSLKLSSRLGGHFVTGHIDCTATLIKRRDEGSWAHATFRVPVRFMRQIVSKGSVCVDGVSLTVVTVDHDRFNVALIPHTLKETTLVALQVGSVVNIETDLLAKYVERQIHKDSEATGEYSKLL